MKVTRSTVNAVCVQDVSEGSTFTNGDNFYIKTNDKDSMTIGAVNLKTGALRRISKSQLVYPIDLEVVEVK